MADALSRDCDTDFMINDPPKNGLYRGVGDRDPLPYLQHAKGK